jgi:ABC-2 type transport system permease protein
MTRPSHFRATLRKLAILFRRDLAVARSYRAAFVLELFYALFGAASFFFLSKFIESPQLEQSLPQGTNYFSFVLVGLAFFDYMSVALHTFDESLQDARQNGTLENLLVTQTSLPVILAGSSLYPFVLLSLRTTIYLGWGAALFGFPLRGANWPGAILILAESVLAFSGLGILSASYLLVFKRGNPVSWAVIGLSDLKHQFP